MAYKLKYETGVAATIQFIIITLLNFIKGISGSVSQCLNSSSGCAGNIVLAIIYFLAITVFFAALWITGFAAQDRRSRKIAGALIGVEFLVLLVGLYELMHHTHSILSVITGIAEVVTSAWISWLALRLIRAKGGRVRTRSRKHRPSQPSL